MSEKKRLIPGCRTSVTISVTLLVLGVSLLSACATVETPAQPAQTVTFAGYQQNMIALLRERRAFREEDPNFELIWNAPHEWRPADPEKSRPERGILLVHGLGDSPWSFHDIGQALADQGFLVRTVLLPGHGTRPEDLRDVTLDQWRQVVSEQAAALQLDVRQVYLGGFSTGANLVLEYAYAHPDIAGLVLFSPGFRSGHSLDWLTPLIAPVRPRLVFPDGKMPLQSLVRYLNTPTNGFAQFYLSSRMARRLLHRRTYDRPVFMAVAQHDSVLDTAYLLDVFQTRFTHPANRLIWYGSLPSGVSENNRVLVRNDRLPEHHISQFSHMGLLFSPANPLYGESTKQRFCWNGQSPHDTRACENGAPVWYSDWGYREEGKIHAPLTWNPYFDWQMSVIAAVLDKRYEVYQTSSAKRWQTQYVHNRRPIHESRPYSRAQ